jgi:hypothetical protein
MSVKITSDGKELELVAEHSLLLLDKNDEINIKLPDKGSFWNVKILFTEDNTKLPGHYHIQGQKGTDTIIMTLNKWYATTWIENKMPISFGNEAKTFELFFKFRTTCSEQNSSRYFIINIWRKNL